MANEQGPGWHLDRRLPVALIATLIIQTGMAFWWAATVSAGIAEANKERILLSARVSKIENERDDFRDRMTRMEVQMTNLRQDSTKILEILRDKSSFK